MGRTKQFVDGYPHGSISKYTNEKCRCDECREAWRENARRYARARRVEFEAYKDRPCMDCGGTFPPECMQFDHRPGENKQFILAKASSGVSRAKRLEEMSKCDLVCANCHAIRTRKRWKDGD